VARQWNSYLALGDSFTEGLDDLAPDGSYRGWADRVAERLAAEQPDFRYGNLAVRGKLLRQITAQQVPAALDLRPDLVSMAGGVNDLMRPSWDIETMSLLFEDAVRRLRAGGSDVLLFVGVDPSRRSFLLRRMMPRIEALNALVARVAAEYDCLTTDLFGVHVFDDPRLWAEDRLHLSPEGHARVAGAVLESLGRGDSTWREPLPPQPEPARTANLREHAHWTAKHLGPWIGRRLVGRSSGDGIQAKRPGLTPLQP